MQIFKETLTIKSLEKGGGSIQCKGQYLESRTGSIKVKI
jgi:hypothetical protein